MFTVSGLNCVASIVSEIMSVEEIMHSHFIKDHAGVCCFPL